MALGTTVRVFAHWRGISCQDALDRFVKLLQSPDAEEWLEILEALDAMSD
jgi:hypothetical protein